MTGGRGGGWRGLAVMQVSVERVCVWGEGCGEGLCLSASWLCMRLTSTVCTATHPQPLQHHYTRGDPDGALKHVAPAVSGFFR